MERQLHSSCLLKNRKAKAFCGPGRVSRWQFGYQELSADYHAVEQRLLMITSDFRQNWVLLSVGFSFKHLQIK